MFSNVLVGVDGTPGGRDAIAFAARLTAPPGRITLVHVRAAHAHGLRAAGGHGAGLAPEGSQELLEYERSAAQPDADWELVSSEAGSPGAGLHLEAEGRDADPVVVGSSSRGIFGRAALGDDTRGALNGAPCAVAIAARGYEQHPSPLARVGVAYNGTPESEAALAAAQEIAAPTRAEVTAPEVVSVATAGYTALAPAAYEQSVRLMLAEGRERMRELKGARGRAVFGVPGEELAAFAGDLDLLVVGSRSYGPVKRLVLGSTSDYLAGHARSSLLVLRVRRQASARCQEAAKRAASSEPPVASPAL